MSRRTAPGTVNQVKVTIVPPDFRTEHFDYAPNESYREYVQVKESLTAEEFSDIMKEVGILLPYKHRPRRSPKG